MIDIRLTPPPTSNNNSINQQSKRKNEENIEEFKKLKNLTTEDLINSNPEWPQFIHPDGGILKITPWGSIRQYIDSASGESITKFEDLNFEEYSFKSEEIEKLYNTPNTPQSIYNHQQSNNFNHISPLHNKPNLSQQSSSNSIGLSSNNSIYNQSNQNLNLSPSNEIESYVVDGYQYNQNQQQQHDIQDQEFQIEHENYFGMN
ncbi:uncharacterized protein KGF55_005109 [Candida pseudojiufengensis]|uniref:uncharacterized protein n=1 Tax=Candida pseudojiufengensis TaxID=497109 RepID=UPI0022252AEE|nr:uncharacterized protein KGF55_005109 [Candida pseudojiufengensis]KAI5959877.1 hypothetical protein KGF55_005109 [Candida pseudojiufengensis]